MSRAKIWHWYWAAAQILGGAAVGAGAALVDWPLIAAGLMVWILGIVGLATA